MRRGSTIVRGRCTGGTTKSLRGLVEHRAEDKEGDVPSQLGPRNVPIKEGKKSPGLLYGGGVS